MNLKQPRSSLEEVRAHILEDLDEAIKYLPVEHAASEYGRATKGAAYALRGKVHLYDKEWQSAINDFEEIVYNKSNNYGYALDDDYARVFKLYNGAKSPETVFSIQNKSGVGTEYGMQIQALMGCRGAYGSCWNNTVPSTQLVDMYEFKDGRPFNWDEIFPGYNAMTPEQRKELLSVEMDGSGTIVGLREADTAKILSAYTCRDPRLMATVIVPYSHYMGNIGRTTNVDLIFALDHNLAGNANGGTIQNNAGWVSYLYRKFEKGKFDGTENPYAMAVKREVKDQFMVGENLLVAPLFAGETERKVILPQGRWYDFYTGKLAGKGEVITVSPGLDRIPVYVKDGGIVPLCPPITELDGTKLPLEIRHYGSKPGTFRLYDDDGETYNYEKGEYTYLTITVDVAPDGSKQGKVSVPEGREIWSYNGEYTFRYMTE